MFGPLGVPELLFILGLALLIFGPRELPRIGRTLGKAMSELRRASNELKRSINTELIQEELRQNDPRRIVREAASEVESLARDTIENPLQPSTTSQPEEASGDGDAESSDGRVARDLSNRPSTPSEN